MPIAAVSAWAATSFLAADMATRRRKATRYLTTSAVLAALGVIFLALGAFVEVLDLTMAAVASLTVVFAVIELKGKYPLLVYLVTSVLALLLLPSKTPALVYFLFAGYYPILKAVLEGHLSRAVSWLLKMLAFLAAAVAIVLVSVKVFALYAVEWQAWYILLLLPLGAVFAVYDVALSRLITAYMLRLRGRFRFLREE
ncbi:MAG: hypothetical protein IKM42_07455 [Clostridia bacterium]|nr:hypothetical protein [Clostridia bacterium]MBR3863469.1 hypothetical protein [Clostridia bacterium]